MTPAQFATYIRYKTKTSATTFPDAEIISYANVKMDEISKKITKVNENIFGIKMLRNLEANKRNYAFEPQMLNQMLYLEAKLDGTNYEKLDEYNLNSLGIVTTESEIQEYFTGKNQGFMIFGGELYLLTDSAITDITDGLRLWCFVYPKNLSALTGTDDMSVAPSAIEFGFPRQFHELLARAVIIEWKNCQDRPIPLTEKEKKYDFDLQETLNEIKGQNLDRIIQPASFEDTADDGYNY